MDLLHAYRAANLTIFRPLGKVFCSMALLAMSPMGILPMFCGFFCFFFRAKNDNGNSEDTPARA
jgi:hypothetical protein